MKKFTPVCKTNELADCSTDEINNAYDNAILYTDYFLNNVIEFLKTHDEQFETAMLYVSDHGESLGENGLYLHGMPNFAAPDSQRHVPLIMWLGKNYDAFSYERLVELKDEPLTHDTIFHTLLTLLEVKTNSFDPEKSMMGHPDEH